jgi:branched-chain amino acid transport system substrate-binding protein
MDVLFPARRVLALTLALFLTACPKSSSPVRPDGDGSGETSPGRPRVEAKKDPTADAALAQAVEAAAREQDPKRAAESFLVVRKAYPETTASQEALYRAGVLFYEAEDYVNARKSFNELLFENPLYPQAQDVKLKLARSALEVGAYRDAYQTLSSLAERAQGAERLKLLEDASRAAQGAGLYSSALTIEVELAEQAQTPEAQAAAAKRLEQVVEGRADFVDIARVAEGLSPRHPAWPILTFKLARIYYHLRDWTRLEETLNRFLQEAPGSTFAPQAKELLARATRRVEVRPRTVGVLLPMTGRFKPIGEAVLRGVQLALNGSDIELIVKDTQGEVNLAGQGVEQLAFDEGAIAVLGPLVPDEARRAALVSEELQIPLLTMARQEERARHQALRAALPEPLVRRGAGQHLLGRGAQARRRGARRGDVLARPDDVHHRGEEARGPVLPGGPGGLHRGRARGELPGAGRVPAAQGDGEDEEQRGAGGGLRRHLHPG